MCNMWNYSKLLSLPPHFPRKSVIMVLVLNFALLWALIFLAWDSYRALDSSRKCLRLSELCGTIDNFDEVLTMSARMAAVTGDKKWEDRYRNFEPRLDSAIKEALQVGNELHVSNAVTKTNEANIKLVAMEKRVFDLIHEGNGKVASALLNSPEYESEKNIYCSGMGRITDQINAFVQRADDANYFKHCILIIFVIHAFPVLIIFMTVIFVMIKRYECELNRCKRRFQDFSGISNNWIWEMDCKMRFTYSNHKAAEFIGYAAKDVLGKTLAELMPHSELSGIGQLMDDLMNAPKPFHDSKREISHKDGSSRTFMTNGIPIYNHNDEFNGYRGNCIVILPESTGIPQDAKDET